VPCWIDYNIREALNTAQNSEGKEKRYKPCS
jgi:hypothetical protein